MSADSALTRTAWARHVRKPRVAPPITAAIPLHEAGMHSDRRSEDPIAQLSRQFDSLCTMAVDAAEIAAGLEANGFTDGSVKARFGIPDVFTLADKLFHLTPRAVGGPRTITRNPWRSEPWRHVLRGLTFSAPGLLYLVALPTTRSGWQQGLLIGALVLGWGLSQGMAYVGSLFLGQQERPNAAAWLRFGLLMATVLAAAVGSVAWLVGRNAQLAALVSGDLMYLACAAVVLVLATENLVLVALVPGLVIAATALLAPGNSRVLAGVGSLACVTIVAVIAIMQVQKGPRHWGLPTLRPSERATARWHLGYGLVAGLLVSIPTIVWGDGAASGAALLPLIWSMGFAEWQLLLFRQRTFDVASNEMQLDRFGRRVTRLAVRGLTVYLGWLTVITVMVFGTAYAVPQWTALRPSVPAVAFGWVLGAAFYAALLSTSLSQVRAPVLAMAAGTVIPLMVIVSVPVWFPAGAGTTPPIASAAVIAAPVITVLCLLLPCLRAVTNPSRHL